MGCFYDAPYVPAAGDQVAGTIDAYLKNAPELMDAASVSSISKMALINQLLGGNSAVNSALETDPKLREWYESDKKRGFAKPGETIESWMAKKSVEFPEHYGLQKYRESLTMEKTMEAMQPWVDRLSAASNTAARAADLNDLEAMGPAYMEAARKANPELYAELDAMGNAVDKGLNRLGDVNKIDRQDLDSRDVGDATGVTAGRVGDATGVTAGRVGDATWVGAERVGDATRVRAERTGSRLSDAMQADAMRELALGGDLGEREMRDAAQQARAAYGARGLARSDGAVLGELQANEAARRARENQRRGYALSVDEAAMGERVSNADRLLRAAMDTAGRQDTLRLSDADRALRAGLDWAGRQDTLRVSDEDRLLRAAMDTAGRQDTLRVSDEDRLLRAAMDTAGRQDTLRVSDEDRLLRAAMDTAGRQDTLRAGDADRDLQANTARAQLLQQANMFDAGRQDARDVYNSGLEQQELANRAALIKAWQENRFDPSLAVLGRQSINQHTTEGAYGMAAPMATEDYMGYSSFSNLANSLLGMQINGQNQANAANANMWGSIVGGAFQGAGSLAGGWLAGGG